MRKSNLFLIVGILIFILGTSFGIYTDIYFWSAFSIFVSLYLLMFCIYLFGGYRIEESGKIFFENSKLTSKGE